SMARTDLVRGAVPPAGQPLPPPTASQYYDNGTIFVRADSTYLKQDFSVMQPVEDHGEWPTYQRFDYVVRTRKTSGRELYLLARQEKSDQETRSAVLFALRELTGEDAGTSAPDWRRVIGPKMREPAPEEKRPLGGDWQQFVGR